MQRIIHWIGFIFLTFSITTSCVKLQIEQRCCKGEWKITTQNFKKPNVFEIHIPQAFTPNKDGLNDQFYPIGVGWDLEKMVIKKGLTTVYESTESIDPFWDGGDAKDGRYKYLMTFRAITGDEFELEGNVCVMRYGEAGNKYHEVERTKICECTTYDMLDSLQGAIYVSKECPSNDTL